MANGEIGFFLTCQLRFPEFRNHIKYPEFRYPFLRSCNTDVHITYVRSSARIALVVKATRLTGHEYDRNLVAVLLFLVTCHTKVAIES